MKKIYLGIFLLSTVSFASGSYIEGKIGTDLYSEYGKEVNPIFFSKKSEKGGSFEIGFEFMKKVNDKVDIGLGFHIRNMKKEKIRMLLQQEVFFLEVLASLLYT